MTPTVNEAAFVASTDGRSLYVPPGTLKAGVDYTFEFSVSDGSRGYARQVEYCHGALAISFWRPIVTLLPYLQEVKVNPAPSAAGSCSITSPPRPFEAIELDTPIDIVCEGFDSPARLMIT